MSGVIDTNVLLYAANRDAPQHERAFSFLAPMLTSTRFTVLSAGPRHWSVLSEVIAELRSPSGNLFFDIRTVALMREHGVRRIYSADTGLLQFEGIDVRNPVKGR